MTGIIESYYHAFNHGDVEAMLGLLDARVIHEPCQGKSRAGIGPFREFLDHMNRCYKEHVADPLILYSPAGNHAAAEFFLDGKYLKTDGDLPAARGQRYRLRVGAFFEIGGNRITRITNHYNLQDWIDQISA